MVPVDIEESIFSSVENYLGIFMASTFKYIKQLGTGSILKFCLHEESHSDLYFDVWGKFLDFHD